MMSGDPSAVTVMPRGTDNQAGWMVPPTSAPPRRARHRSRIWWRCRPRTVDRTSRVVFPERASRGGVGQHRHDMPPAVRPCASYQPMPCTHPVMRAMPVQAPQKLARFEQAVLPHLAAAYNLARWLTRDAHDAEDVVQDAYVRAWTFFDSFHGGDSRAWLLTIVRHTCYTWLQRHRGQELATEFDEARHSG